MGCILSEPAGISIIIINSRNPAPKFKFCSVFSAKNPTVNDASGDTMLSVRNCSRGGDDFWCAGRTTRVRFMFPSPQLSLKTFKLSKHGAKTWSGSRAEWLHWSGVNAPLERREKRALIHSRLWSHPPQQTEYTSSFLRLRPIQAKIKTFITLFDKCKPIYGLKTMQCWI